MGLVTRGYLDVIVDIWQLQGKAAAEVPLCAPAGVAGRQLRPVRLHDTQTSSGQCIHSAVCASAVPQDSHIKVMVLMQEPHPCVLPAKINDR